jgi:hypothetical protein
MTVCRAVYKANCYHRNGHDAECGVYTTTYMVVFGVVQIFFSQLPNFHDLEWLSILAAVMSFAYSFISVGLSLVQTMTGEAYIGAYSVPNRNYSLKKRNNPHHTVKYTLILFYPNKLYIIHLYFFTNFY